MGLIYERLVRPILFLQDAEKSHDHGVMVLKALGALSPVCRVMERFNQSRHERPIRVFGLTFPNAVGLAAGMDKNAHFWRAASALGFGHVEIGTVTSRKQAGNPRPRLFRYPDELALINRMGFNNDGAEVIAQRLRSQGARGPDEEGIRQNPIPLGINIGKSKVVSLENAAEDYLASFNLLADFADYFTINVSSPNTPDLRKLQGEELLRDLLRSLREANDGRARKLGRKPIPMLVKISPDLKFDQLDRILELIIGLGYKGIIATNTTTARPRSMSEISEDGGLSGLPLHSRSVDVIRYIHHSTNGKLPIIGVGGIIDPVSAGRTMDAGASLVQIYSGLVFRGPFFAKTVDKALAIRQMKWI